MNSVILYSSCLKFTTTYLNTEMIQENGKILDSLSSGDWLLFHVHRCDDRPPSLKEVAGTSDPLLRRCGGVASTNESIHQMFSTNITSNF